MPEIAGICWRPRGENTLLVPNHFCVDLKLQLTVSGVVSGAERAAVKEVKKGSDAEKAGLKAGDEITEVQNRPLAGPVAAQVLRLTLWMRGVPPGTEVSFTVKRKEEGKEKTLTVTYTVE